MRIAWITTLTAEKLLKSRIFSEQVVPCLRAEGWDVDVFVDDRDIEEDNLEIAELFHYHRLWQKHSSRPYDLFLYLLEDSPRASFVAKMQKVFPGATIFFDSNLNSLYLARYAHSTSGKDLDLEVRDLFGEAANSIGDWYARKWKIDIFDQLYIRGKREAEQSLLSLRCHLPVASGISLPDDLKEKLKNFLGIQLAKKNIVFYGTRLLEDRLPQVFHGLTLLDSRVAAQSNFIYLVDESELSLAENIAKRYLDDSFNITFVSFKEEEALRDILLLADVLIVPRFDPQRSWPMPLYYALSAGVPCIVSDALNYSDLPAEIALRISLGKTESREIALAVKEVVSNQQLASKLSLGAKEFAKHNFDADFISKKLKSELEASLLVVQKSAQSIASRYASKREDLLAELKKDTEMSEIASLELDKAIRDFNWSHR